jgi:hypothetical protein
MEHPTATASATASASSRSGADVAIANTPETDMAPGTFDIPSQILPGLFDSGPVLPVWLTDPVRRLFKRATPSH